MNRKNDLLVNDSSLAFPIQASFPLQFSPQTGTSRHAHEWEPTEKSIRSNERFGFFPQRTQFREQLSSLPKKILYPLSHFLCILGISFLNILEVVNSRWYLLATLLKRANFIFILCRVNILFNSKLFIVHHLGYRGSHVWENESYVKEINSKLLFMLCVT